MPTYDYQCDECDHTFELFQGINDPIKRKCPKCGRLKLRRLIGPGAAIVFKGSGFYQTDYRSADYKKRAESEKKAASKSSESSDSKTDSSASKKPSGNKPNAKQVSARCK